MSGGKFIWYNRTVAGKLAEMIITVMIITVLVLSFSTRVYAVDASNEDANETAYRIMPLQEKLAALDTIDIDNALALYSDMGSHWSRKEVGMLSCIEIVCGYNGMFKPDDPVQADQFIKMTVRAMGFTPDENTKYWAQNYINIALEQKLITDREFSDYRQPITREEAARIIVKAALLKEEFPYSDPYNSPDNLVRSKIGDYPKIKDENKQFVLQSYEIGLIKGSGGLFRPADTLTRAEASTIIIRYLDNASRVPFTPADDEVYTCVNPDGTVHIVWPPPIKEVIDAANAFRTSLVKTNGYIMSGYSDTHVIAYNFYENEDEYKENSVLNIQMGIDFDTINDAYYSEHPYHLTIYDAEAVKRLHRDVIYDMFKFWFEDEVDKAMAEFDRYLGYAIDEDQEHRIDEIIYNGRLMFFHKIGGDNGFTLNIHTKK